MTREKAIDIIKCLAWHRRPNEEDIEQAIKTLKQAPKWIPVSERLPENNDSVLVYDNSDIFVAWYGGIEGNWHSADNRFNKYIPIIAWQPLPEPYKAEKGGEEMKIEHEFEYDAYHTEIADEFCAHDSEYQADVINDIGLQFKIWSQDKTRTMTHVQILEIAEQLNENGKWFIETLSKYLKGGEE